MSDEANRRTGGWAAVANAVPMLQWLPAYRRSRLRGDVLAGAIVAALLIPQSLGYARIAGVPVQIGLYAVPLALLAYAALGSSPQLIVGPASTVAIVSGSLVADIARDNPQDAVAVTSALALAAGVTLVGAGLLRIGWIAEFLSRPIVTGFVFGLTLTIVIGELPTLLGIPKPPGDLIGVFVRTIDRVGDTDVRTALVSSVSLLLLFGGRRLTARVPWGLITLVAAVVASKMLDLQDEGVATIGDVPSGLPPLGLPLIPRDDLGAVLVGGVSLALVALAEGLAATRLFATRGDYRVETERELVGMGAANIAAGLSGGLSVAGSLSKTAAAEQAGSRSQVTGLTSAGLVIIVLVAFTWFFTELPQATLSAIVIAAVWGLMDVTALRRYRRVRNADFVAAAVGIAGVVLFGPLPGLGIAIVVSLLAIIYRSSSPRIEVLGKIGDEKAAWGRVRGHPDRRPVAGIVVVRLDAPLFWANATAIEDRLVAEIGKWPDTRALVLDLEATTQLDTTAADVLAHLQRELARHGVNLYLARVLHRVESVLERAGFFKDVGKEHTWHSISQCVRAARRHTGLKDEEKARRAEGDDAGHGGDGAAVAESRSEAPADDEREPGDTGHAERVGVRPNADAKEEPGVDDRGEEHLGQDDLTGDDLGDDELGDDEGEVIDEEEDDVAEVGLYAGGPPLAETARDAAVNLYLHAIRDGHPREAVEAYVGDRFTQHSTGPRDGVEGFVDFYERFVEHHPVRYIRVVRTIEDGPFVFLHVFQSLNSGEREWITANFFLTDRGRVVEHWDVVVAYAGSTAVGPTPIDGPTEIVDLDMTAENKAIVRRLIEKSLITGHPRRAEKLVSPRCIEHGSEAASLREMSGGNRLDELVLLVGQGNFVATLCTAHRRGERVTQVDIFRLEFGVVVEHWSQAEAAADREDQVDPATS